MIFALAVSPISLAQQSATVDVPETIEAGEPLRFTITLDRAPNFEGGGVLFTLTGPEGFTVQTSTTVRSGQPDAVATYVIPASAPGGEWTIHLISFYTGTKYVELKSTDTTFQVVPKKNLIYPSSAKVRINLNQQQLLRKAAIQLQLQIQNLRGVLAEDRRSSIDSVESVLRRNTQDAIKSLTTTQKSFQELTGTTLPQRADQVFFEDLRTNYEELLDYLDRKNLKSGYNRDSTMLLANFETQSNNKKRTLDDSLVTLAALHPFEQNELAYNLAADTQSLFFDLTLKSYPEGASVCHYRRGDGCNLDSEPTNTTIKSLPLAIWTVEFRKAGYKTEKRIHNPFTESNHVVDVKLEQ
jgi:hypothetical protein